MYNVHCTHTHTLEGSKIRMKSNYLIRYMLQNNANRKNDIVAYFVALTSPCTRSFMIVFFFYIYASFGFPFFSLLYFFEFAFTQNPLMECSVCSCLPHIITHELSLSELFFWKQNFSMRALNQRLIHNFPSSVSHDQQKKRMSNVNCATLAVKFQKDQQDTRVYAYYQIQISTAVRTDFKTLTVN